MSAAVAAAPAVRGESRGRTRITSKALQRVVAAVAGEALGVDTKHVDADLTDHEGVMDLEVHAPITVPSIARIRQEPRALERAGGSVLDRAAAAESTIRDRVREITDYDIRRVTLRVTDVELEQGRRVQ